MKVESSSDMLVTADHVVERLAADPLLRPVASQCVLPTVWTDEGEMRYRREDLEAWIAHERRLAESRQR